MSLYDLGASDPLTEKEKLEAAVATYRAQGKHNTANKLEAQLQALEMERPRGPVAKRAPAKKAARPKKGGAVVIPGTPTVYRTSPAFPMWPLVVLGTLGAGSYFLRRRR